MEHVLLILAILAIFLATISKQEHMTNKDLMSTLQTYGTKDEKKDKKKEKTPEAPIYGPKALPPEHQPKPSSNGGNSSGQYPDIYGPDVVSEPGKLHHAKHASDEVEDSTYDYNPDLKKAFPVEGPPTPYLGSFAAFQR